MNVTFRQLRVFVEVARQGSMIRAAATLHLTPPAVSMQIKEIESQVGLPLFDREGRQVILSTAGEYFLVHARRLLAALKEAEDAVANLKRLDYGVLTIGMVSTAKYFVPRLLARFRAEHPAVDLRLRVVGNREQLVDLLRSREVDLAVMGRAPKGLATRAEGFAAHPLVFVCPSEHPLLGAKPIPVTALADQSFVVRESGSGTRAAMQTFFDDRHFAPHITMEMSSNETIKQAVMAGMGISFLSLHTVWLEVTSGLLGLIEVIDTPVMRTWNLVSLQSKVLSPAADAFRRFILEHGESHLLAGDTPLLRRFFPATWNGASA
ncbi:MAG TPA: LysR substrate-binding domain-containing protein [Steroidobacteraceae bacterium]|nr:LysR substrate-binding domain-containing protein [Steroidobacteraceae bacterium]